MAGAFCVDKAAYANLATLKSQQSVSFVNYLSQKRRQRSASGIDGVDDQAETGTIVRGFLISRWITLICLLLQLITTITPTKTGSTVIVLRFAQNT